MEFRSPLWFIYMHAVTSAGVIMYTNTAVTRINMPNTYTFVTGVAYCPYWPHIKVRQSLGKRGA